MKKMLFITVFPPNRKTAGQNYSKELLTTLVNHFEVDLISFSYLNHKIDINHKINVIKIYNSSKLSKLIGWLQIPIVHPIFASRFRIDILLYLLKNEKKYNSIYFDFSQVFIYSFFLKNKNKIMMCHDVIFQKMKRTKWFIFNPFNLLLYITEKKLLEKADVILTFSEKDQGLLKKFYNLKASVVNFYIDEKIKQLRYDEIIIEHKFCFFGAWNRIENLEGLTWFMENVFPFLNQNIKFEIIGPGLHNTFLNKYKIAHRVKYVGFIENPYLNIAQSLALIAPIFQGAGVKVKVIESLATGTTILGTEIAFEGINDLGDGSMLLCNTSNDYIKKINSYPLNIVLSKIKTKSLFERSYSTANFSEIIKEINL